jgi:hypothetical protein
VLFVPGLTKRLLSVPEWNSCNGQIYHMIDRQRVEIFDDNREICAFIDLPPCPGATEGVEHIHAVSQREEMRAKSGPITKIPQSLLHRRLGHRSIASLMMADQDVLWEDVQMIPDKDEFCETCQITLSRKANRGKHSLENLGKIIPGQMVMVDIIHNPAKRSITTDTYFRYYLGVIDVASRYFVPMGLRDKRPTTVFNAMRDWATAHGPSAGYTLTDLEQLHGDFDSTFRSEEFTTLMSEAGVRVTYAAPRHQEHNGICESNWKNIRKLAFAFMNDAQVDLSFFPMALEHAWKVHATLPHTALTMESGDTQSPHLVYFGKPARVADFKVLFCPVIMNYDDMLVRNPNSYETNKHPKLERLNRKNNSQNGLRGMHVGVSRHSRTYMIWSPTTGKIYHTRDCIFDQKFYTCIRRQQILRLPQNDGNGWTTRF